ncbi:hypothetical protein AMATHDRAFT_11511 [Amanita thiersii Skay4041]|uniref:Fungal-type protein kinase domain-containing protein n=1 Tax=Amanita thiersii Skay4041 TaxID=703135 RepID=A0A2A9NAC1_9AGAR|nr:hypothetical protein AMATHDRAFT_11511 [Amanita thiersii Skay4041]
MQKPFAATWKGQDRTFKLMPLAVTRNYDTEDSKTASPDASYVPEDEAQIKTELFRSHSQIYTSIKKFMVPGEPDNVTVEFKCPAGTHPFKQYPHNGNVEDCGDITCPICCDPASHHCYQLNRVHSRTTPIPVMVGVPLVQFTSTKHLVSALQDAIKGHQALFECGLLHRHISPQNILLIEGEELGGLLHDLDYFEVSYIRELKRYDGKSLHGLSKIDD